ncbi:MAG: hypothetical protein WAM85_24710 [Terracidiphilus sp.]
MKSKMTNKLLALAGGAIMLLSGSSPTMAASAPTTPGTVSMTVTASVDIQKRMPEITRDDIVVRQGKSKLEVADWVPARGDRAGLELFILIDETADARIASQYDELRAFINAQPASTMVGVGYMRNASVQIAQDLTVDHRLAAQSLRLPIGHSLPYGSPYLAVTDLMKRWPGDGNRREVIMFTDGIGRDGSHRGWHRFYHVEADSDTAIAVAQRTSTNIFTICAPGSARARRGTSAGLNGQFNMTRLSNSTGGASFYLGLHAPVSIQPYLAQVQTMLDNQYILSFWAKPGKKAGLQTINLSTEVAGVNLVAHDAVWVAANK